MVSLHVDWLFDRRSKRTQAKTFPPEAFVHLQPDGKIVITVNRLEFGQGVLTALPIILAEELDASWSDVTAVLAPAAEVYKDPMVGLQMTFGSTAIANSFQQYREIGAKTRAMLIASAAARWNVRPDQCRTDQSVVYGPANQTARYGELAGDAVRQPIPDRVPLKDPSNFRLIGKKIRRLDSAAKCNGSQKFGLDLDLPGMKIAVVARPPVFGGRVRGFDDTAARNLPGVHDIFEFPLVNGTAVAVVADRFWVAKRARELLRVDWDLSGVDRADTATMRSSYRELAGGIGIIALERGDDTLLDQIAAPNRLVAEYELPFVAHAPMEPLNNTIRFDGDRAEAWITSQMPTLEQMAIAEVLGLKPEQVTFHVEFAGGGFGRRVTVDSHIQREAAAVAKRLRGTPVKLVWTREDEMRGGYYRPFSVHRVEVGIGDDGMPIAWRHVAVGQSFLIGSNNPFEGALVTNGVDPLLLEGSVNAPYRIPNLLVSAHYPKVNVPTTAWRSVGYSHNTFVVETLVDELAMRAKADPIDYRLRLLAPDAKRLGVVLTLLQNKISGWNVALPRNHAVGIACSEYHGTAVACAVDVSVEDRRPRIHRAVMAIHCGVAVNPLTIESQCQGGFVFGLTQVMPNGAITLKDGRVEQGNFDTFTPPYIMDVPVNMEVHVVLSAEPPTGVGEAATPSASPAVVNALARLTGERYRSLPLGSL